MIPFLDILTNSIPIDPRKDHALVMVRFANDCLMRMKEVVQCLEVSLGPDTADLGMRFGVSEIAKDSSHALSSLLINLHSFFAVA